LTAASQTNIACNGGSNGAATVNPATGGAGSYTYDWTPGTPTGDGTTSISGLSAGTYTCTVTDANSCTASVNFTVTQPSELMVTIDSQTDVTCNGSTDGEATVSATGGTGIYTYAWSPEGGSSSTASNLSAGDYTVTVTDENSCTATLDVTIVELNAVIATTDSQTDVSCNGSADGEATVSATGGTGIYTYAWLPEGGSSSTASNLSAGDYTVTVTDENGCTASVDITIDEPEIISTVVIEQVCKEFLWSNGIIYEESGTYTQTLLSASGCDSLVTLELTILPQITAAITSNDGVNLVAPEGATSYQWINCENNEPINGETNETIEVESNGSYAVIVTSLSGCIDTSDCFVVNTIGFEELLKETISINVYPNPSSDKIYISLKGIESSEIQIYDMKGRIVLQQMKATNGIEINLDNIEPGIYLIKGQHASGSWVKELVKL